MRNLLGDSYPDFEKALTQGSATKALFRTNKISSEALARMLPFELTPLEYAPRGALFGGELPGKHPLHHAGAFYIQDPSAQATVNAAEVTEGMRVLDACASPGGKTVFLACSVGDDGLVVSNEADRGRARTLAGNVERAGLRNTVVTCSDARLLGGLYENFFDIVLADAPCSGEGMFRKYAAACEGWSTGAVRKCAELQREILDGVCRCVKLGGLLIYSTCTFSPEEDELQTENFLARHPDFHLEAVRGKVADVTSDGITEKTRLARRFYPHLSPGEGQYIALMRRDTDREGVADIVLPHDGADRTSGEELSAIEKFLSENTDITTDELRIVKSGEMLCALSTEHPYVRGITVSHGVTLGSVSKGLFRPHHNFFTAYGQRFLRRTELDPSSPECADYIAGRCIKTELDNGWCAVFVGGCTLGGGKAVGGVLKNHYPKGLRMA